MKQLKKNTLFSYAVICVAYIIAILVGILIATKLTGKAWVSMLVADIAATVIIFIFSLVFKNASVYDPYRGVIPIATVFVLAFSFKLNFLKFLMIAAIAIWGGRLTFNWASRFKNLLHENWRYVKLRKAFGPLYIVIDFLGVHLLQTLIVYACLLPVTAAFTTDSSFSLISIVFFLTALGGIFLETYSDYHMNLFKKDLADGYVSGCCKYGLWKNSRHPNYFGEIVFWWSVYFMMLCTIPSQWYLFFGPLINTLMFIFVIIPLAEAHNSGKAGYKKYRASTFMLIPIPKFGKSENK